MLNVSSLSVDDVRTLYENLSTFSLPEQTQILAIVEELERRNHAKKCQLSLIDFCKHIDPNYIVATHHRKLAELLMEIAFGDKDRVAVSIPPRHGKSHLISTLFPAWFLGKYPDKKVLMASHTGDLAVDFGRKVRNIVNSQAYKEIFPNVTLAQDSKSAGRWSTNEGGEYFSCLTENTRVKTKRGRLPAVDVHIGDYVWSNNGWVEVLEVMRTSHEATVTIDGVLECSTNHPIWVFDRGWVHAGELFAGELLHVENIFDRLKALVTRSVHGYLGHTTLSPLEQHQGAMHKPQQREVGGLRGAWHSALRTLADLRELCAGYGGAALTSAYSWAQGQRWAVQPGELPLGNTHRAKQQQTDNNPSIYFWSHEAAGSVVSRVECVSSNGAYAGESSGDDLRTGVSDTKDEEGEHSQESGPGRHGWVRSAAVRFLKGSSSAYKTRQAQNSFESYLESVVEGARHLSGLLLGVRRITHVKTEQHALRPFVNFRVAGHNTFYANGVLTHNCGVGASIAGRGADLLLVDDPHSEQDLLNGNFDALEKTYQWFTTGARTRLMSGGRVAIVHTRWHQDDLIGHLVKDGGTNEDADQYEVFEFPAILDTDLGPKALWPEKFDLDALKRTKASMPAYQWNAQYMQTPTAEEAAIIKREWWQKWTKEDPPRCEYVIMTLDAAAEAHNRADFTALATWGVFSDDRLTGGASHLILLNVINVRLEFPELKDLALKEYKDWEPDALIVEKKSAGTQLYQELRRMGIPVQEFTPSKSTGDKIARVNAVADILRSGMVWYPEGRRWAEELIEQCVSFPYGSHDDMVDVTSMALARFRQGGFITLPSDLPDEVQYFKSGRRAAYY